MGGLVGERGRGEGEPSICTPGNLGIFETQKMYLPTILAKLSTILG